MCRIDVTLQQEDSLLKMDEQNDYATSSEDQKYIYNIIIQNNDPIIVKKKIIQNGAIFGKMSSTCPIGYTFIYPILYIGVKTQSRK